MKEVNEVEECLIYGNCYCCIFVRCIITGRYELQVNIDLFLT